MLLILVVALVAVWWVRRRHKLQQAQALMLLATAIDERERIAAKLYALKSGIIVTEEDDAQWRTELVRMGDDIAH